MTLRPHTLALIRDAHRYSPFYRGNANHLPMALASLDAMGATDAQLDRFARVYASQLEPLGGHESARILANRSALDERGFGDVLSTKGFSTLLGAGAFHGVIRTAFAIESEDRDELAHALSYWESSAALRPGGIAQRMAEAAASPRLAGVLAAFPRELDGLAAIVLRAYVATRDFTLLHGVTGCQAARIVLPFFAEPSEALQSLRHALAAAYLACGAPPLDGDALAGDESLAWEDVHRCARQCDDEHDVKLAYSCWREWQRSGDDLYRRAASARVAHALTPS